MPQYTPLAILFIILLILGISQLALSSFTEGLDAYNAGHYAQAFREWKPLAEEGNAGAEYYLGVMYAHGQGVTHNYSLAAEWYRDASEQGLAEAEYNLAVAYARGQGVPQDDAKAAAWMRKAAEKGFPKARHWLRTHSGNTAVVRC